jgi:hypothetical protein
MNSKRVTFGIGMALAMLAVLTAPVMAGPNTMYFTNYSGDTSPGGISYVELWINITDAHGSSSLYNYKGSDINITLDPSVGVAEDCKEMGLEWDGPGTADLWDNFWVSNLNVHDGWWLSINSDSGPNPPDPTPWGMLPGLYPIANLTIRGTNTGMASLHFSREPGMQFQCIMFDFVGGEYPDQVWDDGTFRCGSPETFTTSLDLGWNLISLPLTPFDDSTSAVLGNGMCTIVYNKVYSYDASANQFVDVTDGTMETGVGYFVDVTTEGTWSYEGFGDESLDIELSPGLNCIGWTNTSADILADGALDSIAGDYGYTIKLNVTSQNYTDIYDAKAPLGFPEFIDFTTMERGMGYWITITATDSCTLTYP